MKITTKMMMTMIVTAGVAGAAVAQSSPQAHGGARGAQEMMDAASMQKMMQGMMPSPQDAASTREFKVVDMTMMHNMNTPYSGNPDVDFRRKMISHHQGAIDMAKVALQHAKDEQIRKLATDVIREQEREIAEMQAWLKKKGVQ